MEHTGVTFDIMYDITQGGVYQTGSGDPVLIPDGGGHSFSLSHSRAVDGDTVTVTAVLADGFSFTGARYRMTDQTDGPWTNVPAADPTAATFIMPACHITVDCIFSEDPDGGGP
jgi:hypothetical protein